METTILEKRPETPTSTTFILEKPAGFNYLPGQFINIELAIPDCDARCNKRNFSLASSPTDNYLMLTTKHGISRFKQTLLNLTQGDTFNFTGPFGHFVLNEDQNMPGVFLSGGIGITPLHAMIKYATVKKLAKEMTIIYASSVANDIPFKKELDDLDAQNERLTIHYTVTQDPPPAGGWTGRTGRIDVTLIKEIVPNWQRVEIYICGPAIMVLELKKLVVDMGVSPERIKSELFTGY